MLNKKSKTNEQGRSMVEMLGVLAIIGVLSVGGIAGYTTAMNSHHANETVNQARRLAMLVSAQRLLNPNGGSLTSEELDSKFTFDSATTDSIKLTATGLDPKVATRIKKMDMKIASVEDGEDGSLVFTFKNDMSEGGGGEPTMVENCTTGTSTDNPGETTNETTENGACKCPIDKSKWNGTECVKLYQIGHVSGLNHSDAVARGGDVCPEGYHWASYDEGLADQNNFPSIIAYGFSEYDIYGWLSDCSSGNYVNDKYEIIPCTTLSEYAINAEGVFSTYVRGSSDYNGEFVCRHN